MKFNHKFMPIQPSEEHPLPIEPCKHDVLCGKSKYCFRHPGNQTFRKLIAENVTAYKMAPKKKSKMHVVITVADTVSFRGGRFLAQDSQGCWKDGGISLGKKKVGNAFRDAQRGRLRLTTNTSIDGNIRGIMHRPSLQKWDGKSVCSLDQVGNDMLSSWTNVTPLQESIDQHFDSNFESPSNDYHENKWMDQLCPENSFLLEPTIDWKQEMAGRDQMNEYLDDYMIDELSHISK
jgi:hypothetical protein